ncbi:hypothetical protein PCASD_13393 [Puccinia coronata f. sp. avenae]|uniref:Uncharacterized protein n=1 Tax=Puccinia coronata f. sp. avenae TaxID=200324 RepID=A0A2N5TZ80_9BASI|nr:hypothetical protein PCASD_13393 [Puccinia coronata f. sp. avenae]
MAAIATHGQAPFQQRIQTNNSIPPSFILLLNDPNGLQLETTDLLQLSNALLFMDTKLRDHVKISSQVRNLGNIHSVFSDEIRMLDSMGIHTVRLISQEYYKHTHGDKHLKSEIFESLRNISNNELEKLHRSINKTLESAYAILSEQDKTSILFHEEIAFLQKGGYHRRLFLFGKVCYEDDEMRITLEFLNQKKKELKSEIIGETTALELVLEDLWDQSGKQR